MPRLSQGQGQDNFSRPRPKAKTFFSRPRAYKFFRANIKVKWVTYHYELKFAVTDTEYAYLIKTQCKRIDLWRFWCSVLKIIPKIKSFQSHMGPYGGADLRFYSPQHQLTLWSEATDSERAIHIQVDLHRVPDNYSPTHWWMARLSWPGWLVK